MDSSPFTMSLEPYSSDDSDSELDTEQNLVSAENVSFGIFYVYICYIFNFVDIGKMDH